MSHDPTRIDWRLPLGCYFAVYFVAWTLGPFFLDSSVPDDNIEQLTWAQHPALGYSKHPPLPTLILWLAQRLLPSGIALTYLLGAAMTAAMLLCAHRIARHTVPPRRAWLAPAMATLITYHTLRMSFYNHNSVLLAASAAAMLVLLVALHSGRRIHWVLLGVMWAAGLMAKYQMVVGIACNVVAIAWVLPDWRSRIRAIVIAGTTAAFLLIPHLAWLVMNDFPPIHYASRFVGAGLDAPMRVASAARFFADQLLRLFPLLALLIGLAVRSTHDTPRLGASPVAYVSRRVLAIHAFGPLIIILAIGISAGAALENHWGTAYLWAIPLWLVSTPRLDALWELPQPTLLRWIAIVQGVLIVGWLVGVR